MIPVILESPYAGEVERNLRYARAAMRDCLDRGEAPFASHLLYTQCLDDTKPTERNLGMIAGQAWYGRADKCVVYLDLGCSKGMAEGIVFAESLGLPVEYRRLGEQWEGT